MVVVVERVQKLFKLLSLLSNKAYHILLHANAKITILLIHEEFEELRDFGQRYSDALLILYTMIVLQIRTDQIIRSTFILKAVLIPILNCVSCLSTEQTDKLNDTVAFR
jgi:hypothetical protein